MLEYFLKEIVAKVPVLAGWNSIMFDWQYIQNRLRGYYPDLSITNSSFNKTMSYKNYTDMKGEKVGLQMPCHTLILDMMDVIGNFDIVVMPIKESLSLDYIASESIGMNKIKYDGDLQKLYDEDYSTYVFYNAIDSILVQLIDKRFKTLQNIYTQALYCKEKIGSCFSKIALTEALFFNFFYEKGIKIIPNRQEDVHRGTLVGAYVRTPTPGKHDFVCCNDFASLYPSSIITCNMSIENFVCTCWDENELRKYRNDHKYIVVGGTIYKNKGTIAKPELGEFYKKCFLEDELDKYRANKNYFVSVNGTVYKNDKDYAFKIIQSTLKSNRNVGKYLAKQLEALVMTDAEHIKNGHNVCSQTYPDNLVKAMLDINYNVKSTSDLFTLINENKLDQFIRDLKKEIEYDTSFEQAMKLLGNSMYGGSSHVAFFWFDMNLANDITGEARNIIHKMEEHIPAYMEEQWPKMKEFHEKHDIKIKKNASGFLNICYGDTDSVAKDTVIRIKDIEGKESKITIEDLYNKYLNQPAGVTLKGHESVECDCKILNWDENSKLYYGSPKRIIRHKVTKPKWRLKTKSGKEIFVTNDHSMIVFRNGKKIEIKPKDILPNDKILIIKD
jgi:DNA polymerase elongation subunit (family B)